MLAEELRRLVASGRVRAPNYFNGRLLSAGDLEQERDAGRELVGRVGRAVGAGVAYGFEVSRAGDWLVHVEPGLVIGNQGQALELDDPVDVCLVLPRDRIDAAAPATVGTAPVAGRFTRCLPTAGGQPVLANANVFALAVGPKCGSEGSAPSSTLGATGASCTARDRLTGLRFELVPLTVGVTEEPVPTPDAAADPDAVARLSRFRSRVARAFFQLGRGTDPAPPTPWATARDGGGLGTLVPLAVIYLRTTAGITFVDLWPVRRPAGGGAADAAWDGLLGRPRRREVEAMIRQFHSHAAEIAAQTDLQPTLKTLPANRLFDWLPPAALLPSRFDRAAFFGARLIPPEMPLAPAQLSRVLAESLDGDPIDLTGAANDLISVYADDPSGTVLFASRRRQRPPEADAVAEAFGGARRAFTQLAERGDLAPPSLAAPGAFPAFNLIQTRLGAAMAFAAAAEGAARAGGLAPEALAAALTELARLEGGIVEAGTNVLGLVTDVGLQSRRRTFLNDIAVVLNGGVVGSDAVGPALQVGNLPGAVRAQRDLNLRALAYAGDVVAGLVVRPSHLTSLQGLVVIPNGPETTHRFAIGNPNRQPITVRVVARFGETPAGQDWSGTARVQVAQFQVPASGSQPLDVFARAPLGTALGVTVRLFLEVTVIESGFTATADVQLTVANSGIGPSTSKLKLAPSLPSGGVGGNPTVYNRLGPNTITFQLAPVLAPAVPPETRPDVRVAVKFTFTPASAQGAWTVTADGAPANISAAGELVKDPQSITALAGETTGRALVLALTPPPTVGSSCLMVPSVRATGLPDGGLPDAIGSLRVDAK